MEVLAHRPTGFRLPPMRGIRTPLRTELLEPNITEVVAVMAELHAGRLTQTVRRVTEAAEELMPAVDEQLSPSSTPTPSATAPGLTEVA